MGEINPHDTEEVQKRQRIANLKAKVASFQGEIHGQLLAKRSHLTQILCGVTTLILIGLGSFLIYKVIEES